MNRPSAHGPATQSWRRKLHEVIFEAHTFAGRTFDIVLLIAIIGSICAISLETVPRIGNEYKQLLINAEWTFTFLFTVEYVLRIICVRNPWRYIFSFYGLVDLVSILPTYLGLAFTERSTSFAIVRSLRLLRVFRILKIGNLLADADDLSKAIWHARGKIIVFLATVVIVVTIAGTLMYEIEGRHLGGLDDEQLRQTEFSSIPRSIYWAIVTMTTVGYGDMVAKSTMGQFVTSVLILIGYSLIIVPTGFMSAEFIKKSRTKVVSNRACRECMHEDHALDAIYCNQCGTQLE